MEKLVEVKNGQVFTASNTIGEEFGIAHNHILEKIKKLTNEISTVRFNEMYQKFDYINSRGRKYKSYRVNRDGYMFLIMNISTKKANSKKLQFIDAFNLMEQTLLNKSNSQWSVSREQGKQIRLKETDTIKDFVEYATKQGSKSAKFYYKHYMNATYKALSLLEYKKPKARDTLNLLQMNQLLLAEDLVTKTIKKEMAKNENYKAIFEKCKNALINFANSLYIENKK